MYLNCNCLHNFFKLEGKVSTKTSLCENETCSQYVKELTSFIRVQANIVSTFEYIGSGLEKNTNILSLYILNVFLENKSIF